MMLLATIVLQASVALAAALAVAFAFRHRSAALRHFVLASGVVAVLVAAAAARVAPAWEITVPAASPSTAMAAPVSSTVDVPVSLVEGEPLESAAAPSPRGWPSGVSPLQWVVLVWVAGAAVVSARLFAGLVGLRRVAARAVAVRDERLLETARDLSRALGVTRAVTLLFDEAPVGTWGTWRPRIVLTPDAADWDGGRLRAVMAHELAHVQRFDWLVQLAAEAVCAALWFNPLAWVVARRLRDEGERACDDVVLATGVADHEYATHLFDIARAARGPVLSAAMPMARPSSLEGRIAAMLNPSLDRRRPSPMFRFAAAALLLAVAAMAAVRVTAQQAGPAPLQGVVYDSSGAVLPGVEMALVNEQGVKWSTPTDGAGRFEFAPVGAGKYVLEAVVPGFKTLKQDVVLERARDWNKVLTLQVGSLEETIQVTARRPRNPVAAAPVNSAGRVRVGGNIKAPRKVFNANPVYPEAMREAGLEGEVKLDVLIGTDGIVQSVRVVGAQVHPAFAQSASDAVKLWKFTPTLLNGVPVEVAMTASISFSLSD